MTIENGPTGSSDDNDTEAAFPGLPKELEQLVAEQREVQKDKFQGRTLDKYDQFLFPGQDWKIPQRSASIDLLKELTNDKVNSVETLLSSLVEQKRAAGRVLWADMGSGRAFAMRQLAAKGISDQVDMIDVDLFDYGLTGLDESEMQYLEELTPGATSESADPKFIQANIETVQLPQPADLITCVEAIQYLNNPLAAIANWYNQLNVGGIAIIATDHDLAGWIRYENNEESNDRKPAEDIQAELSRAGVRFASTYQTDWEGGTRPDSRKEFRELVVQRKSGTRLQVNSAVTKIWVNPSNYKAVYYQDPKSTGKPIIEVIEGE